ncbi:MAG: hypothetical protein A4E52_01783 [Pelotomaculum sp. PtaB.Bin013]|uniref:Uncharacterized protein n=1 Tax=Pelotomaculum isophthalicicum JI TaxID=947010 RepID=A0A9X4H3B4_9FIRM|nr:hypothetical protein [Pelotomaculum isophthalicicum]MDF9409546.1 hypothetical protein [Pelotomaculum isophthalicicum JI]OPX83715.1 MAG: hypothetical protein A4E52_01783 [Pelotomaculum sp. PtaB.Bin013]
MARRGAKSKYTAEKIFTCIELANIIGIRAAGKLTNIPWTSIHTWKKLEKEGDLMNMVSEKCSGGTELQSYGDKKRQEFIAQAWDLVLTGVTKMAELIPESSDLRSVSTATGIIMDKLLLISGEATSRSEHLSSAPVSREALVEAAQAVQAQAGKVKRLPRQHEAK